MSTVADFSRSTVPVTQPSIQPVTESVVTCGTSNSGQIIETGDFHIDVDSRSVTVRGHKLHLTAAEFDVLVFLTSHRRRLITSRTRLATTSENGGGRQTDFLPALLSLRKKLHEEVPNVHYIETEAWLLFDFHPGTERR